MRVERLELLAYGHYADTDLDFSRPATGLTIVVGPNEAGKSTARRALLAALWGFPRGSADAYRYGQAGLRLGAMLRSADGSELHFVRQGAGKARLVDVDGSSLPDEAVPAFLGGATRELYERLFCVDHDELRLGSEALLDAGGEIGRLVFGAALGARPLGEVLRRLDVRAGDLYKEGGRRQPVVESLAAYREAMRRTREMRVRSREVDRRREAVTAAEEQVRSLRSKLEQHRAELTRRERVRTALPLVAQRAELHDQLEDIGREGVVATPDWASRVLEAQTALEGLNDHRRTIASRQSRLDERIAGADIDSVVLERAEQIELVVEGLDRYKNNAEDLPERQGRLRGERRVLEGCLRRLGIGPGPEPGDWVVSDAQLANVENLAATHVVLAQAVTTAAAELAGLDGEIEDCQRRLGALPVPPDAEELVWALKVAIPVVARAEDLLTTREEISRLRSDAAALASRLGLGERPLEEVEGLPAPSSAEITTAIGAERVLAERRKSLEQDRERHERKRADLSREVEALVGTPGVPEPERLESARGHRDAGWVLVRRALMASSSVGKGSSEAAAAGAEPGADLDDAPALIDENPDTTFASEVAAWAHLGPRALTGILDSGAPNDQVGLVLRLADGYENAVADADVAADERYAHAEDLSRLGHLQVQEQEAAQAESKATQLLGELEEEAERDRQRWVERWTRVGVEAGTPGEMVAWPEGHGRLLALIDEIKKIEQRASAETQAAGEAAEMVVAALESLGAAKLPRPGTPLPMLVAQAEEIVTAAAEEAQARDGVQGDLDHALTSRPARSRALDEARQRLGDWEGSWSAALVPLRLDGGTPPVAAMETVHALRDLASARQDVADLDGRIRGIERDMAQFVFRVQEAASDLGLEDDEDPVPTAGLLRQRLGVAREAVAARRVLEDQLHDLREELEATDGELSILTEKLHALRGEARCEPDADIRTVADRANRAHDLGKQIGTLEKTLLEQGAGRTREQILAETTEEGIDGDQLTALVATLQDEIAGLEQELDEANRSLGEASRDLAAVTDAGTAADIEQEAQSHLAKAATAAAEYARTAVAAAVLRQVVVTYGERHRGPILDRAGTIFSDVTAGAFVHLVPDTVGDQQVLLAQRRNGEMCSVNELSDGARDQLYFALRLAGIEYQLSHLDEPLPVVFDDVLVNFDDNRTAIALRSLASLGAVTQVLVFTHHEGVMEAARTAIGQGQLAVVQLDERDHDTPPSTKGATPKESTGDGTAVVRKGRGRFDTESKEAFLDVLRRVGKPMSKREILAASGVPEERWSQVIRRLVDTGAVVQEGEKRGARYRTVGR